MSFNFDTNTLKYLIQRLKEFFALKTELHEHTNKSILDTITTIPTKTSQLTNDSGFITSANIPTNAETVNGYSIWVGTQSEYDAITTKSNTTLYFIKGS